jgi:hypothetical protein
MSGFAGSYAMMSLVQVGVRLVAKFFIAVIVGISLGASVSAYGAGTSQSGTLSGRTVQSDGALVRTRNDGVAKGCSLTPSISSYP